MQLKELPIGEVQSGIELPGWTKSTKSQWSHLFSKMKVNDCVRLKTKKEADSMKAYFRARDVPTRVRNAGDGTYVVWRMRKTSTVKKAEEEAFPARTLF